LQQLHLPVTVQKLMTVAKGANALRLAQKNAIAAKIARRITAKPKIAVATSN